MPDEPGTCSSAPRAKGLSNVLLKTGGRPMRQYCYILAGAWLALLIAFGAVVWGL